MSSPPSSPPASTLSAAAHALGSSIVVIPLAFAISVVVARALGPSGKGTYDLAVASAGLLSLIIGLALPAGITYAVAKGLAAPRRTAVFVLVSGVLQFAAAWVLLVLFAATPFGSVVLPAGASSQMQTLVALLATAGAAASSMKAVVMGRQQVARASWLDVSGHVVLLTLVAAIWLAPAVPGVSPEAVVAAAVVANLARVLVLGVAAVRHTTRGGPMDLKAGMRVALPSYASSIVQFLNHRLDLFLVGFFRSVAEVGLYALAGTLTQLIWLVSGAIAMALFPRVAAQSEDAHTAATRTARLSRVALASSFVLAAAFAVLAVPLLRVLYGAAFEPAAVPIWLLLPGAVLLAPVSVLGAHLAGLGRTELNLGVAAASLVVTIALDLLLIPGWGMAGAAIASSIAYTTSAVLTVGVFARLTGTSATATVLPRREDVSYLVMRVREGSRGLRPPS